MSLEMQCGGRTLKGNANSFLYSRLIIWVKTTLASKKFSLVMGTRFLFWRATSNS
jgi:hypothetical protein